MPDTVEDLLDQLNRTKEALNSNYCDGELKACDDLNKEAWVLFGRYMLALAEREAFKKLRAEFAEKYAAAMPDKEAKDLPAAITALGDQIVTTLAGIDAQADSLNYDQATKDLNALFTGGLADLQKAVASFKKDFVAYDKGLSELKTKHKKLKETYGSFASELKTREEEIDSSYEAMLAAEAKGDFGEALSQKRILDLRIKNYESRREDLQTEADKVIEDYRKELEALSDRWDNLLDASPLASTDNPNSTDPGDETKALKDLQTEVLNAFSEANASLSKKLIDSIAMAQLDDLESLLNQFDAEQKKRKSASDQADYDRRLDGLRKRLTAAAKPPFEILKSKEAKDVMDSLSDAEGKAAEDNYAEALEHLDYLERTLTLFETAVQEIETARTELQGDLESLRDDVRSAAVDATEEEKAIQDEILKLDGDIVSALDKGEIEEARRLIKSTREKTDELVRKISARVMKDLMEKDRDQEELEETDPISASKIRSLKHLEKKIDEQVTLHIARLNNQIDNAAGAFEKWVKTQGNDEDLKHADSVLEVVEVVVSLIGTLVPDKRVQVGASLVGKAISATRSGIKKKLDSKKEAVEAISSSMADLRQNLINQFSDFGKALFSNDRKLWTKMATAYNENRDDDLEAMLDSLETLAGVPWVDGSYQNKLTDGMQTAYLKWERSQ